MTRMRVLTFSKAVDMLELSYVSSFLQVFRKEGSQMKDAVYVNGRF